MEYAQAFGFREWPFRVVVDEDFARVWADRRQLQGEILRRIDVMQELPHSTVQLIWADFGAGKSHTLRYLEGRCRDGSRGRLLPVYVEVPPDLDGLRVVLQRVSEVLPDELLRSLGRQTYSGGRAVAGSIGARDVRQALRLIGSDDLVGSSVAREWLAAAPGVPNLRTLKSYGISARIEDDARVVEVLAELVRALRSVVPGAALVLLLDEYQRLADLKSRRRDGVSQALVSLFNACPTGLHVVLSLSVAQQATAIALLPQALRSRASTFPLLTLPFLSHHDCIEFVEDLMGTFRSAPSTDRTFPFSAEALDALLLDAEQRLKGAITPRSLMELLSRLLLDIASESDGNPQLPLSEELCAASLGRLASELV